MEQQEAPKFLVIETGDVDYSLSKIEVQQLAQLLKKVEDGRAYVGREPLSGVFIPTEHPDYENVAAMLRSSKDDSEE